MTDYDLLQQLADIEHPAPPEWQGFILLLIAVVLLLTLIIWAIWHWRTQQLHIKRSPITHALGLMDELKVRWSRGDMDDREAAYCLSTLLRLGLGLRQIDLAYPAILENSSVSNKSPRDKAAWEKTITLFSQIRYQQTPSARLDTETFEVIRGWLKAISDR